MLIKAAAVQRPYSFYALERETLVRKNVTTQARMSIQRSASIGTTPILPPVRGYAKIMLPTF